MLSVCVRRELIYLEKAQISYANELRGCPGADLL
jgi:hypothetical protein